MIQVFLLFSLVWLAADLWLVYLLKEPAFSFINIFVISFIYFSFDLYDLFATTKFKDFCSLFLVVLGVSCVWLFATPWTAACQAFLSITNSWSLLNLMSIESVMPTNHLFLCCPFFFCPQTYTMLYVNCTIIKLGEKEFCTVFLTSYCNG